MARGDDRQKGGPAPPRRNPFRTEIKSPKEVREEDEKRNENNIPSRLIAPANRHEHDPADFELLSVNLSQQIGQQLRGIMEAAEKEIGPNNREGDVAAVFEKKLSEMGFLSPSVEVYLKQRYRDPSYKSPEEVARDIARELAEDIMAYSEAKDNMPYGAAHREMSALLNDPAGEWETKTIIKNFSPISFKN